MSMETLDLRAELDRWQTNMTELLRHVGLVSMCKGCKRSIVWIIHMNGKRTPYDHDGANHFITCPRADSFRTKGNTVVHYSRNKES